jgi:cytochrome P450 family 142 subfamily A polypeptide 1
LKQGDELLLMYASANRDPLHFDSAEAYDVTRTRNQHLAFGLGTHFCLGASVARMEIRILFEELLRRLPDFRLAGGTPPEYVPSVFTRGPGAVHIEFTPEG